MIRLISFVKTQVQIFIWTFMSKQKFKSICWIFLCENKDANEFIWFYLSKHKIKLNFLDFLDFSCQKSKFDLKIYDKYPVNMDQIDFFCQNTDANEFLWIFMSKKKLKSIFWIFSIKKQIWFEKI